MARKNKYWRERVEAEQRAKIERDRSLSDEMDRLYSYHFNELEKEIRAFYERYSIKEHLPVAEVKKRVDDMDVKAFEDKAKRYVAEKDFSAQANRELGLYNLKMKVNRLELLQYNMDLEMLALSEGEHKMTARFLDDEYTSEVKNQAGLLGQSVAVANQIEQVAKTVINTSFNGAKWSDRIWERQTALRQIVARATEDLLLKGKNPTRIIPQLRREFNVSANQAKRLAVTEGARVQTEAQKQSLLANGYDEYEYIAEPKACDICRPLSGKVFKVSKMIPGENAAPLHPYCRCSTVAHYSKSQEEYEGTLREGAEAKSISLDMDSLQYFARNDRKELEARIADGTVDGDLFFKRKIEFDNAFENGIKTPLETVYNKTDAYYHIINRHSEDLFNDDGVQDILKTLKEPSEVYETKDFVGNKGRIYLKGNLLVAVRNGIITSYKPDKGYIRRQKLKGVKLYDAND